MYNFSPFNAPNEYKMIDLPQTFQEGWYPQLNLCHSNMVLLSLLLQFDSTTPWLHLPTLSYCSLLQFHPPVPIWNYRKLGHFKDTVTLKDSRKHKCELNGAPKNESSSDDSGLIQKNYWEFAPNSIIVWFEAPIHGSQTQHYMTAYAFLDQRIRPSWSRWNSEH